MLLRLEAYDITMNGWQMEQDSTDLSLYKEAESKLAAANQMIEQLNKDLKEVNSALHLARKDEGHTSTE
jgi:hypothetical protein